MSLFNSTTLFLGLSAESALFSKVAADALANADAIGMDVGVLQEALSEADPLRGEQFRQTLYEKMIPAFGAGNDWEGRRAQFALAQLVRGIASQEEWIHVLESVKAKGKFRDKNEIFWVTNIDPLASSRAQLSATMTTVHVAETTDRQNRKALGYLGARAAFGEEEARNMLSLVAKGASDMARSAAMILSYLPELADMAETNDRIEFAMKAKALLEIRENDIHLEEKSADWKELGRKMIDFEAGIVQTLRTLDYKKETVFYGWKQHANANKIYHDEVMTPFGNFRKIGEKMVCGELTADSPLPGWYFGEIDPEELAGIVKMTTRKNLYAILIAPLHLKINIPDGIRLLMSEKERFELRMAIGELINNALKYYDPQKSERWIEIRWDKENRKLVIADNGKGEIGKVVHGTGFGMGIVNGRLEDIRWKMEIDSQEGIGSTMVLSPPSGTLQNLDFDLDALTPEQINAMTPEDQIGVAERVFMTIESHSVILFKNLSDIPSDLPREEFSERWEKTYSDYENEIRRLHTLEEISKTSPVAELYRALWSAIRLISYAQIFAGRVPKRLKEDPAFTPETAKSMLQDPLRVISRRLKAEPYYGAESGFVELQDALFTWLDKNFPARIRLRDGWEFTGRREQAPSGGVQRFTPPSWPPDPDRDIHFRSYLNLLGWKMKVATSKEGAIRVTLTAEDSTVTEAIPDLLKKLRSDVEELFTGNEMVVRSLKPGDLDALIEQKDLFEREFKRLLSLFPRSENVSLSIVSMEINESLAQVGAALLSEINTSIDELKELDGERRLQEWQRIMGEIPVYHPRKMQDLQLGRSLAEWLHDPTIQSNPFFSLPWPPDFENDLGLKTAMAHLEEITP